MKKKKVVFFGGLVMKEKYSLCEESNKLKVINTTCILSNAYTITIPKFIREALNLLSEDEITISLKSNQLIIRKLSEDNLENKMILNNKGTVKIPQEFIKLLPLKRGDQFNLYVQNKVIILKKEA